MKLFIASDIHGSAYYCRRLVTAFEESGADTLVLLGDILYHGPRNDLPKDYAPREVIALLSKLREKILAVRGNCEAEVDQMVLPFPVLADYAVLYLSGRKYYLTHGHKYGPDNLPPLSEGDVLLSGHPHVPAEEVREGVLCLNPGSVSIPKEGSGHGYILLSEEGYSFHTLAD